MVDCSFDDRRAEDASIQIVEAIASKEFLRYVNSILGETTANPWNQRSGFLNALFS